MARSLDSRPATAPLRRWAPPAPHPVLRDLTDDECRQVLRRNAAGRLVFAVRDRVTIEPQPYAVADGWLYGATARGTRVVPTLHHRAVTFAVDEIDGAHAWRCVTVEGGLHLLNPAGRAEDRALHAHALQLLRRPDDTVAGPVFRIDLGAVHGRACADDPYIPAP